MDEMDTQEVPNELEVIDGDEEIAEPQPDFSAQEVQIEEVKVTEVEEVTEVVDVEMTEQITSHHQDGDLSEPGTTEGRTILVEELDSVDERTGEGAETALLAETDIAPQAPRESTNLSSHEDAHASSQMTDGNEIVNAGAIDAVVEEGTLQTIKSCNEGVVVSDEIVNDHWREGVTGLNKKAEKNSDADTSKSGREQAAGAPPADTVAAIQELNSNQNKPSHNGKGDQVDAMDSVVEGDKAGALQGDNAGVKEDVLGRAVTKEGIAPSGIEQGELSNPAMLVGHEPNSGDRAPSGNPLSSAQPSADVELGSASTSVSLFNDAMQDQLRAQILVLGALRKGIKPTQALMNTACPASAEGTMMGGASSSALHTERNQEGVSTAGGVGSALPCCPGGLPTPVNVDCNNTGISQRQADPSDLINDGPRLGTTISPSLGLAEEPSAPNATEDDIGMSPAEPSSKKRKSLNNDNLTHQTDESLEHLVPSPENTLAGRPDVNVANQNTSHVTEDQLQNDTDKQLQLAQASAQDAMTTATSALAQSHMVWSRIQSQNPSELGTAREAQIAAVAATVAAAASVAKAAVEAAKAIAEISIEAFMQAGGLEGGVSDSRPLQLGLRSCQDTLQVANRRESTDDVTGVNCQKGDMLDSVVRAAGMAAEATIQAREVLAMAQPYRQARGLDTFWARRSDDDVDGTAEGLKGRVTKKVPGAEPGAEVNGALKKQKGQKGPSPATASTKTPKDRSPGKKDLTSIRTESAHKSARGKGKGKSAMKQNEVTTPDVVTQPVLRDPAGYNTNDKSGGIFDGSAVEVMSQEEGLRGGWFSGKVISVTEKEALVAYDEILTDDGTSNLQEWFPFKEISGGQPGSQRQVRPVHPYSFVREEGSKKRRRVALGTQTWTVGDHVDAFTMDGWWEGVVVELSDIDESKATVYFPGENDTQVVKLWDLRPSLQWADNKWMPYTDPLVAEDESLGKRQKVGGSSSKAKNDKREKPEPKIVEPSPTRASLESPNGKKQDSKSTTKSSSQKRSPKKKTGKKESESKNSKTPRQSQKKDVVSPGTPKKLNFDLGAVTPKKSLNQVEEPDIRTPTTRGKVRTEKRSTRQSPASKV